MRFEVIEWHDSSTDIPELHQENIMGVSFTLSDPLLVMTADGLTVSQYVTVPDGSVEDAWFDSRREKIKVIKWAKLNADSVTQVTMAAKILLDAYMTDQDFQKAFDASVGSALKDMKILLHIGDDDIRPIAKYIGERIFDIG